VDAQAFEDGAEGEDPAHDLQEVEGAEDLAVGPVGAVHGEGEAVACAALEEFVVRLVGVWFDG
jgi:hypothetical protein